MKLFLKIDSSFRFTSIRMTLENQNFTLNLELKI